MALALLGPIPFFQPLALSIFSRLLTQEKALWSAESLIRLIRVSESGRVGFSSRSLRLRCLRALGRTDYDQGLWIHSHQFPFIFCPFSSCFSDAEPLPRAPVLSMGLGAFVDEYAAVARCSDGSWGRASQV